MTKFDMRGPWIGCIVALLATSCALDATIKKTYDQNVVIDEVTAFVDDWARSSAERRWDDLKTYYSTYDGFVWIEQGVIRYTSHPSLVASIDQVVEQSVSVETEITNLVITPIDRSTAALYAGISIRFDFGWQEPFEFDGIFSAIVIKRNGAWAYIQGHMSNPTRGH